MRPKLRTWPIAVLLLGCQTFTGLTELTADGKNVRDAGTSSDAQSGADTGPGSPDSGPGSKAPDASTPRPPEPSKGGAGGHDAMVPGKTAGSTAPAPAPPQCESPVDGATCDNQPQCGCDKSQNCAFHPDDKGKTALGCIAAGSQALYKACDGKKQDCQVGFQCVDGLCKRPCEGSDAACSDVGSQCVQGTDSDAHPVSGLFVCSQTCNPMNAQQQDDMFHACTDGHVCRADRVDDKWHSDCVPGSRNAQGTPSTACLQDADCADGNFCSTNHWCVHWCHVGGSDCPDKQSCTGLEGKFAIGPAELGYCACPDAGAGPCSQFSQCGCNAGQKCDVVSGTPACIQAGTGMIGDHCASSSDCLGAMTCFLDSCHRICDPGQPQSVCESAKCHDPGVCSGGFLPTCRNVMYSGTTLTAECSKRDQSTTAASIDLSGPIGNANGVLVVGVGGFGVSCTNSAVNVDVAANKATLTATCLVSGAASSVSASLELNEVLANIDGQLVVN